MLRKRFLISAALLSVTFMFSACGMQEPQEQQGSSDNEIVLSNENKEDPDDEEDDVLEKPDEALRINVKAVVVGDCSGIGFAPIMGWGEKDKNHEKYELTVKPNAAEAADVLKSGSADLAILPLDTAVNLYNETGDIAILATNAFNNICIADTSGTITQKDMLNGKTVVYADDGSLTASAGKKMLESCGAVLKGVDSNATIQAGLIDGSITLALLPEPYITLAKLENDSIQLGPDITEMWKDVDSNSEIISSVLVARKDFVENNKSSMVYILDDYRQSVNTVIYGITKTIDYTAQFNIVPDKSLAISTLMNCKYNYTEGIEMSTAVKSFIAANADVFDGKVPDSEFYYTVEK